MCTGVRIQACTWGGMRFKMSAMYYVVLFLGGTGDSCFDLKSIGISRVESIFLFCS